MIRVLATMLLVAASSTVGARIPADVYCTFAQQELLRALANLEGRVSVQLVGPHADVELRETRVQLSARLSTEHVQPRMLVWVDVSVDGHVRRTLPVSFEVRWIKPALVVTEHV